MVNSKSISSHLILLFSLSFSVGCGESVPTLADVNNTNIKKVRGAYGLYLSSHGMRGPKNEEVFKEYLTTHGGAIRRMGQMGVAKDDILDMFISERDGKPFKIRYGLVGLADHPVVFETEGVDGKRMVAFVEPREVDADEYEKLWEGKVKPTNGMNTVDAQ